jgi:hypothetical protein
MSDIQIHENIFAVLCSPPRRIFTYSMINSPGSMKFFFRTEQHKGVFPFINAATFYVVWRRFMRSSTFYFSLVTFSLLFTGKPL